MKDLLSLLKTQTQTEEFDFIRIGLASPAVLVALATLLLTRDAHPSIQSVHLLSMMAFLSFTVVSMMRHLFRTAYVNEEILASAVGVYMLFGFLFAAAYQLHSLHFGVSISQIAHPEVLSDFVYFSFSNQTTVGFGDLVPLTPLVKSISIVQVVGGQMFLVVVMARLVGLHLTTRGGS